MENADKVEYKEAFKRKRSSRHKKKYFLRLHFKLDVE